MRWGKLVYVVGGMVNRPGAGRLAIDSVGERRGRRCLWVGLEVEMSSEGFYCLPQRWYVEPFS